MGNWASSSDKKGGGNQVLDSDLDLRDESVDEGMKEVGKNAVFKQTSVHNYDENDSPILRQKNQKVNFELYYHFIGGKKFHYGIFYKE